MHNPVMPGECAEYLNIRPGGTYVDATLGGAGHSRIICDRLKHGTFVAIDADGAAIERGKRVLSGLFPNIDIKLVHDNFANFKQIMAGLGIEAVDGVLADLGVSSFQLDEPERGFSYMNDGRLDMRMDGRAELTAYDVVNSYGKERLAKVIGDYGEERWAARIAEFIVKERALQPIETTSELVGVIKRAVPKSARRDGPHPAKRTFQAIRIEVNSELEVLAGSVTDMAHTLEPGGRICLITFHSLEDRIVKKVFKSLETRCTCPPELPICVCGGVAQVLRPVSRKPITPGPEELLSNHRSRSAKLRVGERV